MAGGYRIHYSERVQLKEFKTPNGNTEYQVIVNKLYWFSRACWNLSSLYIFRTNSLFMRYAISVFLFFNFLFLASAKSVESTTFSIRQILPEKIQSISISKTSKKEIESKLGKPGLIEGAQVFYQIEKLKYDLAISYKDNFVNEYSFAFSSTHPLIKDLGIKIDEKKIRPYLANGKPTKYFIYNYLNYDLVLNPIDWSLYSIKVHK